MGLDLSFLDLAFTAPSTPRRPVNVYEILREGWRETRVDMTLQFFLDPNERHGLGPLVIDALLGCLDGAPTIGRGGKTLATFTANDFQGSEAWEISTQVDFIDVLATNPDLGVAVVLENKIGHELNNPLDRYVESVFAREEELPTVVVAVLAPERRTARGVMDAWLSRSITYAELATAVKKSDALVEYLMSPSDRDQHRSLELLQQFIEARTGGPDVNDLTAEAAKVNEWRALFTTHRDAITAFDEARREVAKTLRARNKALIEPIAEQIATAGLHTRWEAHGGAPGGGVFWNAYCFMPEDWSIELKLSSEWPSSSVYVYDYPGRTYKDERREPLGVEWTAGDEQIAEAFVDRVQVILAQVRAGTRSSPVGLDEV